jgi:hypothetical protein
MKYKYFISYAFKQRFGKWGFGSAFIEILYKLDCKSHEHFCKTFAKMNKMTDVVLLNYKEIDHPTEKGGVE